MKKLFATVAMLLSLSAIPAMAATLTGVVTDDMCGAKHMMKGMSDAECVRACVKEGAKYALYSGGKTYILTGDQKQFSNLAGQKVTVNGNMSNDTIAVSSIAPAK